VNSRWGIKGDGFVGNLEGVLGGICSEESHRIPKVATKRTPEGKKPKIKNPTPEREGWIESEERHQEGWE